MKKSTMKKCAKRTAFFAAVAVPVYFLATHPKLVAAASAYILSLSEDAQEFLTEKGGEIAEVVSTHAHTIAEVALDKAKEYNLV